MKNPARCDSSEVRSFRELLASQPSQQPPIPYGSLSTRSQVHDFILQLLDAPQFIDHASGHRRRQAVSALVVARSPTEVVVGDVQGGRSGQFLDFLGDAECERCVR